NVSNGVKFADADLMGMPLRVVVSPRGLAANEVEITDRKTLATEKVSYDDAIKYIFRALEKKYEELK
ncbi:MAG: His/Gly/Thr/Pro-type tRNA ligase C-terminal domain-containing protein, partial [Eubacteriales bacterium]|nr:His/Gly/Thr/Pro-type tRNA ligase C-terminal domain-containing protein [Eubacteriales bacterium]